METQEGQGSELVPFTTRLTQRNKKRITKLAAYEGTDIEKVTNRILDLFFEGVGEIPERKSLLDAGWPEAAPKPPKGSKPRTP